MLNPLIQNILNKFLIYRNHSFSIPAILSEIPLSIACNTNGKIDFFENVSIAATKRNSFSITCKTIRNFQCKSRIIVI